MIKKNNREGEKERNKYVEKKCKIGKKKNQDSKISRTN